MSSLPDSGAQVAVTGASGFIGRRLVVALNEAGYRTRVLMRRDPVDALWQGLQLEVVPGDLSDADALQRLAQGADTVIHLAGLIKATSRRAFMETNRDGSARVAQACHDAGVPLLHVSSIAAREPRLSDYAASKQAGETRVQEILGGAAYILRPAATYGPGDPETLAFFKMAAGRVAMLPASIVARVAIIHVGDLCRLMMQLLANGLDASTAEAPLLAASDDHPEGYSWSEILRTAAVAVDNPRVKLIQAPAAVLKSVAKVGDAASHFGNVRMVTSQKLRELRHLDWAVSSAERACPAGWHPRYELAAGFADAVAGYRALGWLPAK